MPFDTPTIADLIARIEQDLATRLGVEVPQVRRTNVAVLARVLAMTGFTLVEYMRFIADQVIIDTAETEFLARWATVWGVDRIAASAAAGNVTITGTDATVIPEGTALQRADGVEYATDAEGTIAAGTVTIAVTAAAPGAIGNSLAAEILDLVSPIAGANSQAIVDSGGLIGGADEENDEALRARLLDRIRQPPHGGADFDYVKWALEVPGTTRAWVSPIELGLGTVVVRFVMDDKVGTIIPDAAEVAAVQAYIDPLRPVTAAVTVVAPIPIAINPAITLTPNTAAVQAAATAELEDVLRREAVPGGTILLSHLREAVSIAAGETDHVMTAPVADLTHAVGEIAVLGVPVWS